MRTRNNTIAPSEYRLDREDDLTLLMTEDGLLDLFWSYVKRRGPDQCWPWQGPLNESGYGLMPMAKLHGYLIASRFALAVALGRPIAPKMWACHTCDNPTCCNPQHIYEGTPSDNARDRWTRGKSTKGILAKTLAKIRRKKA